MRATILAVLCLAGASPAWAQSDNQGEDNQDSVTIGAGAMSVPRYEGSDDNRIIPFGAVRGSVSGISFTTQGTGLFVDVIPRKGATGGKLVFGPVVGVTLNRTTRKRLGDPQIAALGKIDTAVELGGQVGYSQNGVFTSDYDNLAINLAVTHDVTNTHDSLIVSPSVSYGTPLSKTVYVGASVGADYVGRGYGRTYFGVDAAQSIASGLPTYDPGKGFKDINFGLLGNVSLSGDLRRGLSVFAIGSYEKLLGDFKRSPVVRDSNQWVGGLGIAYTF